MFKAVQFIAPGRNKLCALLFDIIKQPVNGYGGLVGGAGERSHISARRVAGIQADNILKIRLVERADQKKALSCPVFPVDGAEAAYIICVLKFII